MIRKQLPNRRTVLYGLAAGSAVAALEWGLAVTASADNFEPGDFAWQPERSPSGPVAIIVSLSEQRVYVYRNGIEIAVSTCSTGKPGHETPTGVFTILQKDKHHHSSTYNNASMPNMNRLTWDGIALHAGKLPGYPASHGCVRLPMEFSEKLFGITHLGTPVIIADTGTAPAEVVHPGQVLSVEAQSEFDEVLAASNARPSNADPIARHELAAADVPNPRLSPRDEVAPTSNPASLPPPEPSTAILISGSDRRIIVLDNGEIVAEGAATISDPQTPLGHHVFVLNDINSEDRHLHWHTIAYGQVGNEAIERADLETIQRVQATHDVVEAIRTRMRPGTIMVTVDEPMNEETRSVPGFTVITNDVG